MPEYFKEKNLVTLLTSKPNKWMSTHTIMRTLHIIPSLLLTYVTIIRRTQNTYPDSWQLESVRRMKKGKLVCYYRARMFVPEENNEPTITKD